MPNEQNLIPLDKRTKSEQREIQSSGGKASGASRRRRKNLKEAADLYLSLPVSNQKTRNGMIKSGLNQDDIDNQMAIIAGLAKNAMQGDSRSAKVLFDLLGEKAADDPRSEQLEQHNALIQAIKDRQKT